MRSKTFNIYCDESTHLQHDGKPYMIVAYVSSAYYQLAQHKEHLKMLKTKHKVKGEFKWSNVSGGKYQYYADIIDYFFSTDLQFRAVILNKSKIDDTIPEFTYDYYYYRMYYQLLHHKISMEYGYNIYLDIKDTRSDRKLIKLKDILKWNASIRNCQFIRSHESSLMQMADLIMGAINYKIRGENKMIAKTKLIEKIESHCKVPFIEPTKGTDKFSLFFIDLK